MILIISEKVTISAKSLNYINYFSKKLAAIFFKHSYINKYALDQELKE